MGRRRKRRKKLLIRRPTMPTVFRCPNCEMEALTVEINKKERNEFGYYKAIIRCGNCGLYAEMWVPPIYQPVDVYHKFLDEFVKGTAKYEIRKEAAGGGGEKRLSLEELLEGEEHEMEGESS